MIKLLKLLRQYSSAVVSVLLVTIALGFGYVSCQQILRQGANDPQIQLAEDAAATLSAKTSVNVSVLPYGAPVDLAKSLAPFMIVYNASGKVLQSSGTLNKVTPVPPAGVLAYAAKHGENRLTWQPQKNVRLAAVIVPFDGAEKGFVLAGRSLAEVEKREAGLAVKFFLAWILSLGLLVFYAMARRQPVSAFRRGIDGRL